MVNKQPQPFYIVFELDNDNSPYFRSIRKNIDLVDGLSMDNIYIQNLCRNYFTEETSKNKHWVEIAQKYWSEFLAKELDSMFAPSVPVLITTEFILKACFEDWHSPQGQRHLLSVFMYCRSRQPSWKGDDCFLPAL